MKKIQRKTGDLVMAGVTLGAGNTILGAMGQGDIAGKISNPSSRMLGVYATGMYANEIMGMFSMKQRRQRKRRR